MSRWQVDRRIASREWTVLSRGQFTTRLMDAEAGWRAQVLAVVRSHERTLVLAHATAARAWGLPTPLPPEPPLTFIATRPPARRNGGVRVLVAELCDHDVVERGLVLVTSVPRTVVDCARSLPARDALAIADAAMRRGLTTAGQLAAAVERQRGRPQIDRARQVLALCDPRRENAFESWSAWSFHENGVPQPVWQATLCDEDGVFLARPDGWWESGVAGEADGRVKYRLAALERGGLTGENLAKVLDDERARESRLRRAGALLVRWSPWDVLDAGAACAFGRHLRGEIARGGDFRGRVVLL
jgi:hypothetical protein